MNRSKTIRLIAFALIPALGLTAALAVIFLRRGESPPEVLFTRAQSGASNASDAPFVVCLDPGHGGDDAGALSPDGQRHEKDDNLALGLAVRDALLAADADIEVLMTRERDRGLTLMERCEYANDQGASVFVSLHRNSGGGVGVEVWIHSQATRADKALGGAILAGLEACTINRSRGLRQGTAANPSADYVVVRETAMPACIVELGFMDSEADNALFDAHMHDYAAAVAAAILSLAA